MRGMLMRGFTTVRDAGGADLGLREAVEQGLFTGPRLFISGRAISQTGGHGDFRAADRHRRACGCAIADRRDRAGRRRRAGGPAARCATRSGSAPTRSRSWPRGGVASAADPIHFLQYSRAELEAIVDEARARRHLCHGARLHAAGDQPRRRGRRAHDRARQPDRRADGAADGRARRVPGADAGHLSRRWPSMAARSASRPTCWPSSSVIVEVGTHSLRDRAGGRASRSAFGTDLLGELHEHQSRGVPDPRRGAAAARGPAQRDHHRRPSCCAWRASSA